jgi:hypothetical protein
LATVPLERWNELRELLGRIARNQPVLDYESERLAVNGGRIPVALSYTRMPTARDRPQLYLEIAQDIRERLLLRRCGLRPPYRVPGRLRHEFTMLERALRNSGSG